MNAFEMLLETTPMRALGWTLVHFVWQGVALFVLHEIIQAALLKRSASARYVAACVVLLAMMASAGLTMRLEIQRTHVGIGNVLAKSEALEAPVLSASGHTTREGATPPVVASHVSGPHIPSAAAHAPLHASDPSQLQTTVTDSWDRFRSLALQPLSALQRKAPRLEDLMPWLVSLWIAGVFFLTTRLAIGWQEARWLRNRAVRPVDQSTLVKFGELLQRLRLSRSVQVLESSLAEVPTVVGWLRPVVLLPTAAITGLPPQHLQALIAHELTHINRHDYLVNLLQTMIETLLFYHPAVWWVSNRIRDERENCCDDVAVEVCGDAVLYARALTTMEELRSGAVRPELAMAADGGSLVQRVRRLVGRGGEPSTPGAGIVVAAILLAMSSLLAVSAGRTTEAAEAWIDRQSLGEQSTLETENLGGKIAGIQEAQPAPQLPRPEFELEEIIGMERFGIDVDFYDEMTDLFGRLEVDELVALKMYEVDSDYVEEISHLFGEKLEFEEAVRLRQQGVEKQDIEAIMEQAFDVDPHEAIALHLMGVQPDAVQDLIDLQMPNASLDGIVQLAQLGLDAEDVLELQEELGPLSVPQSIALLTNGVDGHDIEELREMGMENPDPETLVHMYSMGLSADVIDTILDDEMEDVPVEALLLFKELGLEEVFMSEFRRRNR